MFAHYLYCLFALGFCVGCNGAARTTPARTPSQVDATNPAHESSLHIECQGKGRPPVILEAGLGNDSSVWSAVVPEIAKRTRVCAYDRAGLGASKRPVPKPHSNQQMAEELHDLLRATGIPGPYVLVGHSMGGANIRYFAAKDPAAVEGMVLVDSVSEHQPARFWALLPEATLSEFKEGLTHLPEGIDFDTFRNDLQGLKTASPSLGRLPLVVLAHGRPMPPPPGVSTKVGERLEAAWRSFQEELSRLSSNSAYLVVEDAGHHIQLDRPDIVVAAINEVVECIRHRRPINPNALDELSSPASSTKSRHR